MASDVAKLAISVHLGRIAPVFDVCQQVELFDLEGREAQPSGALYLGGLLPQRRMALMRDAGVDTLICGAITGFSDNVLSNAGIRVIAWMCGSVPAVLAAYLDNTLASPAWQMPGCRGPGTWPRCGRRRRRPGGRGFGRRGNWQNT